jgi:ComF family protein
MKYITQFSDFFLPRFCPSCKNKLSTKEKVVCDSCFSNIKRADSERLAHEFERKFFSEKIICGFISLFVFEKDKELQQIIHELKYNGKFSIGTFLGKEAARQSKQQLNDWHIDFIVPVPLHHLKRAERGYNQSDFIGMGIKSELQIPLKTNAIRRIRFTETQTSMNLAERKENMQGAFKITKSKILKGKNILLIDDVITTGATITECGKVLKEIGANNIYAASVAIAD